jgi:signal transduction histidine kinase/FixJ family two-component response regulator
MTNKRPPNHPPRPFGSDSDTHASGAPEAPEHWLAALHEQVLALELRSLDLQPAVQAVADCLTKAGFAPERMAVAVLTLHPGLSGMGFVWLRTEPGVRFFERPPGFLDSEEHRTSPFHEVLTRRSALFLDEAAIRRETRFPIVREFVRDGATSYLALPLPAARGDIHVLGIWTARPGGWCAEDAAHLARVVPLLTLLVEVTENRRLLGLIGTAHELTQRALAEQALRNADALVAQQAADMAQLEIERQARLATELQLQERSVALAERNAELRTLTASLEDMVVARTHDLEQALARANAATLAKSRFLAMMSHEIRTPMHGVLGLGELLSKTALDTEQARYVSGMQSTGSTLMSLLNGILDFSRIEADRIDLESAPFEPARLLDEIALLLKGTADAKGLSLVTHSADDVPAHLEGDPTRLRQVWTNLIGNALKFTEFGGVSVTQEVATRGDGSVTLRGRVRDTGIGIPPEMLPQLWEPFTQGDGTTARRFGGSGLGLAICKGLVERMGGSLAVESRPGEGATFTFLATFRLAARASAPPAVEPPADDAGLAGLRVLVVDDNAVNRLVTERQLAKLGTMPAVLAEGGRQALAQFTEAGFDVVLMDMQMPDMDGLETTRQLRTLPAGRRTRIIGMSANAFPEDRLACLAAGMDDFMPKPLALSALRDALRGAHATAHDRTHQTGAQPAAEAAACSPHHAASSNTE